MFFDALTRQLVMIIVITDFIVRSQGTPLIQVKYQPINTQTSMLLIYLATLVNI